MRPSLSLAFALGASACTSTIAPSHSPPAESATQAPSRSRVVLASEVDWQQLNPARGDASPGAADLWGDRKGPTATGYLFTAADGFESPPHVHNVSYRGVVIRGLIHNDDPDAEQMWMPAASFWTQPKGAVHITAAKGSDTLAYIEIEEGPYLVYPPEEESSAEETPINVHQSNLVWVDPPGQPASVNGAKLAYLWGKPQDGEMNGTFVKLPSGLTASLGVSGSTFGAVVIRGRPILRAAGRPDAKIAEPGSYFSSTGKAAHQLACQAGEDCILYVRMEGKLEILPAKPES